MKKEETFVTVNREYKDTMFRVIFREKKELLSLYNAVNNSDYQKEEDLQIVTLENAVYMNVKNDLAFLIDFHLHLYEHQMQYVERVRSYARKPDMTLETAVERAVDECIKENILADFLRRNRAEAIHMSIFEYDEEKELALIRKDEYNAGVKAGKREGIKEGMKGAAVRMLTAGTYSIEEIASISGLPVETVGMLKAVEK